ncbi:MAG: hypothetical protein GXO72_05660 [Caldiserica bacterium]|nr:hypothetical protein [Caldisericota bacterium]
MRELWERGVRVVKVFISDDLPGIEETVREVFPQYKWPALCGPYGEGSVGEGEAGGPGSDDSGSETNLRGGHT